MGEAPGLFPSNTLVGKQVVPRGVQEPHEVALVSVRREGQRETRRIQKRGEEGEGVCPGGGKSSARS